MPYSELLVGLKITVTLFLMGKKRHGAIYYLFMELRNNHHRYVLSDSSDELNNIRVSKRARSFLFLDASGRAKYDYSMYRRSCNPEIAASWQRTGYEAITYVRIV